jgi:hypothetical protein
MATARDVLDLAVSEADWERTVTDCARTHGWQMYHPHDSRRSREGWPDWAFWKPGQFFMAELKKQRGKLSPAQEATIASLREAAVEVYVWRPSDWPEVEARFRVAS